MSKTVIFVEGQTELIFVREFIKVHFDYFVDIKCNSLCASEYVPAEHDWSCKDAPEHFWIINASNDEQVLSQLLLREEKLYELKYDRIIGLRDMYSAKYRKYSTAIDAALIKNFIEGSQQTIKKEAKDSTKIIFLYSIMEIESWILAFDNLLEKIHGDLTHKNIKDKTTIDLTIDPEISIFHPAGALESIMGLVGLSYDKSKHEIESIVSKINDKTVYKELYKKPMCQSYNKFYDCF